MLRLLCLVSLQELLRVIQDKDPITVRQIYTPLKNISKLITHMLFPSEQSYEAWGGNYFIAGGEVRGKKILGNYPDILSEDGPLIFEPGIVIPTLAWDSIWNGVAQWIGITNPNVSALIYFASYCFRIYTSLQIQQQL